MGWDAFGSPAKQYAIKNHIHPKDAVRDYGTDALRVYEMFIGDYSKDAAWSENGLKGCAKFLNRVWNIKDKLNNISEYTKEIETIIHKTIKKVTNDLLTQSYNTAVSSLMILLNEMDKLESISPKDYRLLLHILNPIAPILPKD